MTQAKGVGKSRFWAWLAGIVLGMAMLFLLAWVYAILATLLPTWAAGTGTLIVGFVLATLWLGLIGGWLVPKMQIQTSSPYLGRLGMWMESLFCLGLAMSLGMVWGYSGDADLSTVGQTLVFFSAAAFCIPLLLSALMSIALFLLLLYNLFINTRQCRLLAAFTGIALILYPLALIGAFAINLQNEPIWEITKTTQAHNQQVYSVLRANRWFRGSGVAALSRHKIHNPLFSTVQIILLDKETGHPHSTLLHGAEHKDTAVREVCRELLKTEADWAEEGNH